MGEKTVAITIRIPTNLAEEIDELIEDSGLYVNKPDFIMQAIRYFIFKMEDIANEILDFKNVNEGPIGRYTIFKEEMTANREQFIDRYKEKNDGGPRAVLLRMPIGFLQKIDVMNVHILGYSRSQDTIRIAIIDYMDYLKRRVSPIERTWELRRQIPSEKPYMEFIDNAIEMSKAFERLNPDLVKRKEKKK